MGSEKILVTGPSWIGDMVMAQSLFKTLKTFHPQVQIDVLAPDWTLPVVERMPEVSETISLPGRHGRLDLMMRIRLGKRLKSRQYDQAIVMPRSFKAALPSFFAGIKKRIGFSAHLGLINQVRPLIKSRQELFVRRYLSLVMDDAYGIPVADIKEPALRIDSKAQIQILEQFNLQQGRFVVICPGAEYGPAKRWPVEYFAKLADELATKKLATVLVGSSKERPLAQQILAQVGCKSIKDLCGQTSLPQVADLMNASLAVVTNDSGLMHLACASNAKVISLFGSSSPRYTPPLSKTAVILEHPIECRPCFARTCRFGHYHCLTRISIEQVLGNICYANSESV